MAKQQHSKKIFNNMADSLVENEIGEHTSPRRYLESQGVDVDSLLNSGMEIVNQWKNNMRSTERQTEQLIEVLMLIRRELAKIELALAFPKKQQSSNKEQCNGTR